MTAVLETEHLRVVFKGSRKQKEIVAVDDLTLHVDEGEVVGFIGPNGAGKTTTIKVLMGFIFPTSGTARIFGEKAGSESAKSRIGYLPEVALYYPFMTVEEILRLYGSLQGIGKKEMKERLPALVSSVGLVGFEKMRLRDFSKGMLQRVGLAQAIMGDPELLLLDEVTSGLDPVGRVDLRNILLEFRNRGGTVFFSSHELSEVAKLCDRIVLINEGKVIQEKSLEDIMESRRRYRLTIEAEGLPPPLPVGVKTRMNEEGKLELETNSGELQRDLLRRLPQSGARILEVETDEGSLENYFVEIVGHKVT